MLQISMACANMQLLPRVCFCFLTLSGLTFGDRSGPGVTVVVSEGDDAILPCSPSTKESIVEKLFDWKKEGTVPRKEVFMYDDGDHYNNRRPGQDDQFKGRVSHFPDQLQFGNASIIIRNTILADRGDYTCDFPHLQSEETTNIKLVVGASPEPIVRILDNKGSLQCEVKGASPEPTVEWWDSENQTLHSEKSNGTKEGRPYITLKTKVTKTSFYRCVSTQKELFHQIYTETFVQLKDATSGSVMIRATIVSVIIGIIVAV